MKKGRSESAALLGVDRGYATLRELLRELHFFLEYCEDDFQALLTSTRQVAPSVSRARNPSSDVFPLRLPAPFCEDVGATALLQVIDLEAAKNAN
jgi:hypothetical protein